ncbi:MAG TPA: histone family protein [Candidatus Nanoarchaeia archaeon]|nr:histone family protein [Candidatus Nanoarchaeia archaeon]
MGEKFLPLAAMEKLLKQGGSDRVSDKAKTALKEVLEQKALEIGKRAAQFAEHAGRKTIKAQDIRLAVKG